jgi:hypothetical protein
MFACVYALRLSFMYGIRSASLSRTSSVRQYLRPWCGLRTGKGATFYSLLRVLQKRTTLLSQKHTVNGHWNFSAYPSFHRALYIRSICILFQLNVYHRTASDIPYLIQPYQIRDLTPSKSPGATFAGIASANRFQHLTHCRS